MKHENTRTLHNYWNRLRGRRTAPMRLEIDPGAIASILGNAFVLERVDPLTYRYRLAGTRVCAQHGAELRGTSFTALWCEKDRETIENLLFTATEDAAGALIGYNAHAGQGRIAPFEMLLLPLARDNGVLDRVIGTTTPLGHTQWVGSIPVTRLDIKSIRLLWPDGLPGAGRDLAEEAAEAASAASTAASARPSFRIIEGGLR